MPDGSVSGRARALAGAVVVLIAGYAVLVVLTAFGPAPPGTQLGQGRVLPPGAVGAASPEEAVQQYVQALNDDDLDGLLALSGRTPPSVEAAEARLRRWGSTAIVLDSAGIQDGLTPIQAIAQPRGASSRGDYEERLALTRMQDRWLVAVSSWFGETPYP